METLARLPMDAKALPSNARPSLSKPPEQHPNDAKATAIFAVSDGPSSSSIVLSVRLVKRTKAMVPPDVAPPPVGRFR